MGLDGVLAYLGRSAGRDWKRAIKFGARHIYDDGNDDNDISGRGTPTTWQELSEDNKVPYVVPMRDTINYLQVLNGGSA